MKRTTEPDMRLIVPTDFEILHLMSDGKRYTATLVAHELEMKSNYMRTRIQNLAGQGLIQNVENSSMYEITDLGHAALELREEYAHERSAEWGDEVRELAESS